MSLLSQNKNNKKGNKNAKSNLPGAKSIIKPGTGKAASFSKKPIKTGGARGS